MAIEFRQVFRETGALLYSSIVMPPYSLLDAKGLAVGTILQCSHYGIQMFMNTNVILQERKEILDRFLETMKKEKSPITWVSGATSGNTKFASIDIFDYAVNLFGPHSLD